MLALTLVTVVAMAAYAAISYPVLRHFGVRENLFERSVFFGLVLFVLQAGCYSIAAFAGLAPVGAGLGLLVSYFYVRSALTISPWQKLLVTAGIPAAVWLPLGLAAVIWVAARP